jgi:transcription antitermination factor NusG
MSSSNTLPESQWFALYTKTHHEKRIASMLRGKGYAEFLPLYWSRHRHSGRFQDVQLPLFANYVFCRFNPAQRLPILTTPGVFFIVGGVKGPEPIVESEIEALQSIVSAGLRTQPWPFLQSGDRVSLLEGPLRGTEGIIESTKGECRLIISITLLQRSVAVEVDRRWVKPIGPLRAPSKPAARSKGPLSLTAVKGGK